MNTTYYTQNFTLEDIHLNRFGRLKPSVLLYFVQEISGQHAARLGAGWEALAEKKLFWAIIRHKIHITRMPTAGETIRLETWPMPTTRTAYPRATVAYDAQGNELFRTLALWVLMDPENRTMVLPGRSGVEVPGILRGLELDTPGSLSPAELENSRVRQVSFTELDRNGHMNNTRYLDWIDDLLSSDFHSAHTPEQIHLCYLSEAREGDEISLKWSPLEDNVLRVEATREDGKVTRIFAAQITFCS